LPHFTTCNRWSGKTAYLNAMIGKPSWPIAIDVSELPGLATAVTVLDPLHAGFAHFATLIAPEPPEAE
jgi:hypothetical protein